MKKTYFAVIAGGLAIAMVVIDNSFGETPVSGVYANARQSSSVCGVMEKRLRYQTRARTSGQSFVGPLDVSRSILQGSPRPLRRDTPPNRAGLGLSFTRPVL